MLGRIFLGLTAFLLTATTAQAECFSPSTPLIQHEMDWHIYVNFQPTSPLDGLELFYNEGSGYAQVFFTRRDGTQVHVTSEPVFRRSDNDIAGHVGPIEVLHDPQEGIMGFATTVPGFGAVEAEVRYDQPPSAQFGGLTDARNHASRTMLPLMYRNKSGLVQSVSVQLNGERLEVPNQIFGEGFEAPSVYLTQGWQNVMLYAFDTKDADVPDPALAAFLRSHVLQDLNLVSTGCDVQASLTIDADAKTFALSYGELASIWGSVEQRTVDGASIVLLHPQSPDWARPRTVALVACDTGRMLMKVG